jgi:hypothetical protein
MSKSLAFRFKLRGQGIVNYDSSDQKFYYNQLKNTSHGNYDNIMFGKKLFFIDQYGNLNFTTKISSNLLRNEIFKTEMPFQNPTIKIDSKYVIPFYATPSAILRGFMF